MACWQEYDASKQYEHRYEVIRKKVDVLLLGDCGGP
jgi:hypothetical protein